MIFILKHICSTTFKFRILSFGIILHSVATYDQIQGKFYELYELDAEIGHKELDWKMTLSGVGKCRQVTSCYFHKLT